LNPDIGELFRDVHTGTEAHDGYCGTPGEERMECAADHSSPVSDEVAEMLVL
jgi:hypothetical protein